MFDMNFQWTWVSGDNSTNMTASYGTTGEYCAGNFPGGRRGVSTWVDSDGKFLLFGGGPFQNDSFNDLWIFDPDTLLWAFLFGSLTPNINGSYVGTKYPGSRELAASWTSPAFQFFLFGGRATLGALSDFWELNITGTPSVCPPPTTAIPTTAIPTTAIPTTAIPTTADPTTAIPTTGIPTTAVPTTAIPTTGIPTTAVPTTGIPTTAIPTTAASTTGDPGPSCTASWQCPNSGGGVYATCISGHCHCRPGFSGTATSGDPCVCNSPNTVIWDG